MYTLNGTNKDMFKSVLLEKCFIDPQRNLEIFSLWKSKSLNSEGGRLLLIFPYNLSHIKSSSYFLGFLNLVEHFKLKHLKF